jgi:hypothetical protein
VLYDILADRYGILVIHRSFVVLFCVSRFGKDKSSSKTNSVIDRVRAKILERCGGTGGIKGLAK